MDFNSLAQSTAAIVGILAAVTGVVTTAIIYVRAKVKKQIDDDADKIAKETLYNLKTTVDALEKQNTLQAGQIKEAKESVAAQNSKIAELNGTVDTLKNIPLGKIEKHMSDTNKILSALLPLIPTSVEHTVTEKTITK
jgi:hypothetical protein